ncbi:MAG: YgiQ family radical SAM protein [Proteobacteria bacterium]|nr:YgiQ family radical SAM protein [Pseudomonadota bacterium]
MNKINYNLSSPLPISWAECAARGWTELDVLLVTGDAYVDHPSYGVALIGRLLLSHGYRVAILAQPHFDTSADFSAFPVPLLFCGITAGNLDSIVANYSGNGKVRDTDAYSPGGNPWRGEVQSKTERRRPDRACLLYASLARSVFRGIPIVLGGIEASLRRFVHYDYKQEGLRSSFLTDAKADIIVYGMGEKAVLEIAEKCRLKAPISHIAGTCQRLTDRELASFIPDFEAKSCKKILLLPSWEDIGVKQERFLEAEIELDQHARGCSPRIILQRQQSHWVVQHPAPPPLTPEELDALYNLPFTRRPHPISQEIPAYRMIRDSVTIVRGCSGNCSFCAITRHQGPAIISRGEKSILSECHRIAGMKDFGGTISDLGGPTANLYGTSCAIGSCKKRDCLFPKLCPNLKINEESFLSLLKEVSGIERVKHLFISSGLRMELLLLTPRLLETILRSHTPGALKIAPEHSDDALLFLMHKEPHDLLQNFVRKCREIGKKLGKKIELTPYIITSHPGSTPELVERLVKDLQRLGLKARKFQDFTPTPGTLSTAMYVTGLRPDTKQAITVPRCHSDRQKERRILEGNFHRKVGDRKEFQLKKKK